MRCVPQSSRLHAASQCYSSGGRKRGGGGGRGGASVNRMVARTFWRTCKRTILHHWAARGLCRQLQSFSSALPQFRNLHIQQAQTGWSCQTISSKPAQNWLHSPSKALLLASWPLHSGRLILGATLWVLGADPRKLDRV